MSQPQLKVLVFACLARDKVMHPSSKASRQFMNLAASPPTYSISQSLASSASMRTGTT